MARTIAAPGARSSWLRAPVTSIALALSLAVLMGACGDDDGVSANPDIAFLVGDWVATRFEVTPDAAPDQGVDLVGQLGAEFTLNVQPSGLYTASLSLPGLVPAPEIGTLRVEGTELVFTRTTPPPTVVSRATFTRHSSGTVTFTGPSSFDLDGDGQAEAITLDVTIVREVPVFHVEHP
jgi:hypothetical protein